MPVVFVNKEDPFDFIEVEQAPEPQPDPATERIKGVPGKFLDIRYRSLQAKSKKWDYTTLGLLRRTHRALRGTDAKNLISGGGDE